MSRASFIVKRFLLSIFSIFIVANLLFFMFRLMPGDPASVMVDPALPSEVRELTIEQRGLDEPLHVQYYHYFEHLLQGDLGRSFHYRESVSSLLLTRAVNTIVLMGSAVGLAFLIGPLIGAYMAWNRNEMVDNYGIGAVLLMHAAPVFWTGMLGIMIFSFQLGWLPSGGMHSIGETPEGFVDRFISLDFLRHFILPVTVTALYYLSPPTFIMRNTMVDVLSADFIQLKRAQGLPELRILYAHAARNSLLPVTHYAALALGFAFGGSVIIEQVFSWPGAGRLMWQAVEYQDYPLAMGAFLALTVIIIMLNFVVDMISVLIDPRAVQGEVNE